MALVARQRTGLGQRIEVPLFDATFLAIGASGLLVDGHAAGGRPDDPWAGVFKCADGRWVQLALPTPRFVRRFVAGAGLPAEWLAGGALEADSPARAAQHQAMQGLFASKPALEWEAQGVQMDVPLRLIRTRDEWLREEHARTSGAVVAVDDPELGPTWQAGPAVRLCGTPAAAPRARRSLNEPPAWAPPTLPAGAARAGDGALSGIRVVDLTQVLAGPTAARTLAEFGADVVKINNPREEGAGYRWNVHRYHTDVNRGKATMLLDLKAPEGLAIFRQLASQADVVLQNFRLGVAERLGVGYEQVRALRPDVIYGSISAYGYGGSWADRPGYEPHGQAVTGISARENGFGQPSGPGYAINDYGTGLLGAFGIALALFHRMRTGQGQHVEVSLARTGSTHQFADFLGGGGEPSARIYQASDGSFVAMGAELMVTEGMPALDCVEELSAAGVPASTVRTAPELMRQPWVAQHGLAITRKHPGMAGAITTAGPPYRLSRTPVVPGRPVARPGYDAKEVLAGIGMADQLDELVAKGVIALE
jgi:crotonobetainyl-CoA:carnitine CoA-transferase CaiB-like acyl-CoA transferase